MKTKSCDDHFKAFASYVLECDSLNEEAAAHLQRCTDCHEKVAELKRVTTNCREAALRISEPRRRLRRAELERSLAGEGRQSRSTWWRPVLFYGAVAVVAIAISVTWKSPEPIDGAHQENPLPETSLKEQAATPTMLALRNGLQGGREQILALSTTRNGINHYRVRDVKRELQ